MKKFLIALFAIFACGKTFAAGPMVPQAPIFVFADVLEYAIKKNFSVMDYDAVTQEWEKRMSADGTVTATDIEAVCKIGRLDKNACIKFRDDLMTYFYPICEKTATKGKSNCVDDFWATIRGTWVRLSEAIGIAQEYAQLKNKETVVCSPKTRQVNPPARASYLKCTSVDGGHYYEFKFNSTTETNDRDIISGTLRAVGKMHNIEFQNSDCTLERIASDSNCALAYKTSDIGQCEKINKSLKRFGYSSKIITTEKFGKRCEVFGITGGNRSAYGIDNTVFQDVQYVAGPEVENRIKAYVQKELSQQNIKLEKFSCDKTTKHDYTNVAMDGLVKKHSEILTCYVNGSPIDFLFADLSENKDYAKNAGLSKMACVQLGGKVDQKKCRGLDEQECNKLGNRLIARGEQGTKYLQEKGGCILSAAATERAINLAKEIVAGIAITVVTEGTATIPVIVSIGTDLAFEAVQIWQRRISYNDYKKFADALYPCYGMKPVEKKWCFADVLNKNYELLIGEMMDLAPEVQSDLAKKMSEIREIIGDDEYIKKASTSEISLFKKARNGTQYALMIGTFFINPEKIATEVDDFARLRKMVGNDESFFKALQEFQKTGRNARFLNSLTTEELLDFNIILRRQNIKIELERYDNVLLFKDTTKSWNELSTAQYLANFDDVTQDFLKEFKYRIEMPINHGLDTPSSLKDVLLRWNLPANATDDMIETTYQAMKANFPGVSDGVRMSVNDDYKLIKRLKNNYLKYGKNAETFIQKFGYNINVVSPGATDWKMVLYKWGLSPNATDDVIESMYTSMHDELVYLRAHSTSPWHNNGVLDLENSVEREYEIIRRHKPNFNKTGSVESSVPTPARQNQSKENLDFNVGKPDNTVSTKPQEFPTQTMNPTTETPTPTETEPAPTIPKETVANATESLVENAIEGYHQFKSSLMDLYDIDKPIAQSMDQIEQKWHMTQDLYFMDRFEDKINYLENRISDLEARFIYARNNGVENLDNLWENFITEENIIRNRIEIFKRILYEK